MIKPISQPIKGTVKKSRMFNPDLKPLAAFAAFSLAFSTILLAGHPVFDAARAAGVFGDIAPQGTKFFRGWIGRIEKAEAFDLTLKISGNNARLDDGDEIFPVNFQDPIHAGKRQDDAAGHRQGAAGKAAAGAARRHGQPPGMGQAHDPAHFIGRIRIKDKVGLMPSLRGVVGVGQTVGPGGETVIGADNRLKLGDAPGRQRGGHGGDSYSRLGCSWFV